MAAAAARRHPYRGPGGRHRQALGAGRSSGAPRGRPAAVCWAEAIAALDRGQLSGSNSENKILRLAASIADGIPADLHNNLSGLDDTNLQHVVTAIRHAAGRRPAQPCPL